MSVTLRWVGETDFERLALVRTRCYAHGPKEFDHYDKTLRADPRARSGDFLLAEDGDEVVGTTTTLDFNCWVRGGAVRCQGIAYVGTVRTYRRTGAGGERGVASRLMEEALRRGRERGQVLSALMPFRVSYYEHFGYGIVERRCDWTVPLAILPHGGFEGLRFSKPSDREAIAACHQRSVQRGQCDMERDAARWKHIAEGQLGDYFEVVDRPAADGPVRGYLHYNQFQKDGKDILKVAAHVADDLECFRRQLHFLASLRDQYWAAQLTMPADVPLNWLLKERQVPHRLVNHPTAAVWPYTRMQVRVLDHCRTIEAMRTLPQAVRGEAVVAIKESEGHNSRVRVTLESGRGAARASDASPDVTCDDKTWAAIVLGDMTATRAAELGLVQVDRAEALGVLDAFAFGGPAPFCEEYF
jgi:predicted acetyltransferase